jgi:hypothetical protein
VSIFFRPYQGGDRLGEDWAEKIACEIAQLFSIPHAHYELAIHHGIRGVITKNFISQRGEHLIAGNELLQPYVTSVEDKANPNIQYINDVFEIMERIIVNKPIGFDSLSNIKSASDFFLGYLMFDTLISNQDRHNENWGMIVTPTGSRHLAPSYDHGASLGRNESDAKRIIRLMTKDSGQQISSYVKKAKSQFLDSDSSGKRLKLLEAFRRYGLIKKDAARVWLDRLISLQDLEVMEIVYRIPPEIMSDIAKEFTYQIILCNKANLISLYNEFG